MRFPAVTPDGTHTSPVFDMLIYPLMPCHNKLVYEDSQLPSVGVRHTFIAFVCYNFSPRGSTLKIPHLAKVISLQPAG